MSMKARTRGMFATAVVVALAVTAFAAASQAQASTLYACVKKNGTARIYSKKPKCKKGESKLSWNTTGPAGKNGANGSNGSNGSAGAAGQPQSAVTFSSSLEASLLSTVSTPLFTLNGVSVTLACTNALVVDSTSLDAAGPTGSRAISGMVAERANDKATEEFQQPAYNVAITPTAAAFANLATNGTSPKGNMAHVNASIVTSGAVIIIDAFIEVGESPKNCSASGVAFSIPA